MQAADQDTQTCPVCQTEERMDPVTLSIETLLGSTESAAPYLLRPEHSNFDGLLMPMDPTTGGASVGAAHHTQLHHIAGGVVGDFGGSFSGGAMLVDHHHLPLLGSVRTRQIQNATSAPHRAMRLIHPTCDPPPPLGLPPASTIADKSLQLCYLHPGRSESGGSHSRSHSCRR